MGNRTILPSKTPSEVYNIVVDMSSLLYTGEAVGSAVVTVTVLLGEDLDTSSIIVGTATVTRNVVYQQISGGLPGVTYVFRVAATTNQGNILISLCSLAVISTDSFY